MRLIFAGTPDFAVPPLHALHQEHEVVAVFTQPDRKAGRGKKLTPPPVKQAALELGLKVHQPHNLNDQVQLIEQLDADVMVVVAYGVLLPQAVLDAPRHGCINIHASLLPRWRGAAPIQRAIEAGDQKTGVSIMQMEIGLDTGPVFMMLETPISKQDTSATLHARLSELGARGVIETLRKLQVDPDQAATPQTESEASYAKKISKAEAEIDWSRDAASIDQKVRAYLPWPICQTQHQGQRLRVWQGRVAADSGDDSVEPGQVLSISDTQIIVACGQGAMAIEVLQRDGSKPLPVNEFCNGYLIETGVVLGKNHA